MIKKVLTFAFAGLLLVWLFAANFFLSSYSDSEGVCREVKIEVIDNSEGRFISENEIKSILINSGKLRPDANPTR